MRKHNNFYIIGVDAGYGNMKTARTIYPTGLVAMDTKPFLMATSLSTTASGTASVKVTRPTTRTRPPTRISTS